MNAGPKFRSPYHTTGRDLAAALGMKTRARQEVHVLTKRHGGVFSPRFVVLVDGEYYEVGRAILDKLEMGQTPADLELDPHNPDDDYSDFEG
ncbi:hypothetical protein RFN29_15040 [Mesorhizobium sp. VK22B]|uniref:DNA-binding protein n=1 Tax=Mesorhizobium captivum TaxID=3072319 RepID=A0ABU4Z4G1_9HYPH|nr:hypothetical protein [Mesorhizobium sp. VK22B]MDX8492892.1 hypothetical protein [Mesorhizobium sp. VK22B]